MPYLVHLQDITENYLFAASRRRSDSNLIEGSRFVGKDALNVSAFTLVSLTKRTDNLPHMSKAFGYATEPVSP